MNVFWTLLCYNKVRVDDVFRSVLKPGNDKGYNNTLKLHFVENTFYFSEVCLIYFFSLWCFLLVSFYEKMWFVHTGQLKSVCVCAHFNFSHWYGKEFCKSSTKIATSVGNRPSGWVWHYDSISIWKLWFLSLVFFCLMEKCKNFVTGDLVHTHSWANLKKKIGAEIKSLRSWCSYSPL